MMLAESCIVHHAQPPNALVCRQALIFTVLNPKHGDITNNGRTALKHTVWKAQGGQKAIAHRPRDGHCDSAGTCDVKTLRETENAHDYDERAVETKASLRTPVSATYKR